MTNRTVITYGTGKGGYEMAFKDKITPNGVDYSVDNYKLVDKSDNDRDVSGEFTIDWDRKTDTVTAVRTADKGEMPLDHQYEFSFDITVSKPKGLQEGQGPRDRQVEPGARGRRRQQGIRHLAAEPGQELDRQAGRQMAGRHRPAGDQQDRRRLPHLPRRRQGRQRRQRHRRQEPDPGAQ